MDAELIHETKLLDPFRRFILNLSTLYDKTPANTPGFKDVMKSINGTSITSTRGRIQQNSTLSKY